MPQAPAAGQPASPLSFGDDVRRALSDSVEGLSSVARVLHVASKQAVQQVVVLTGQKPGQAFIFLGIVV